MLTASKKYSVSGWIDILRHILCVFVIVQHSQSNARYDDALNLTIAGFIKYIDWAVFCFFILSGYFGGRPISKIEIARQSRRLLVPYIIISAIYTIALFLLGKIEIADAGQSIAFLQGVGPQLYFLPYLFFIALFYSCILYFLSFKELPLLIFGLIITTLFLSLNFDIEKSTGPAWQLVPLYWCCYALGSLCGKNSNINEENYNFLYFIIAWTILLMILWLTGSGERYIDLLIASSIFGIFILFEKLKPINQRLGGSGCVYIIHAPIILPGSSIFLSELGFFSYANVVLSICATYIFSIIIYNVIRKCWPRILFLVLE